jgi:hypothetical protein
MILRTVFPQTTTNVTVEMKVSLSTRHDFSVGVMFESVPAGLGNCQDRILPETTLASAATPMILSV